MSDVMVAQAIGTALAATVVALTFKKDRLLSMRASFFPIEKTSKVAPLNLYNVKSPGAAASSPQGRPGRKHTRTRRKDFEQARGEGLCRRPQQTLT
jgi:hypothetical protein